MEKIQVHIQMLLPRKSESVMYHGENITKLKFPCLCTFSLEGREPWGILTKGWEDNDDLYELHLAEPQIDLCRQFENTNLLSLLEQYSVELREGEILFYETNQHP